MPNFLNHKLIIFITVTYCVKKYRMELEMIEDSDQSAHLCSLIRVLPSQSKTPRNKNVKSNVSEHIAHVDLCSN